MRSPQALLFIIITLAPASAFAQGDAGVSDAGAPDLPPPVAVDSVSDQIGVCVSTCIARVSRRELTIDDCVRTAPECTGLTAEGSSIRTAICDIARNLVGQCGPEQAPDPPGQVLAAASERPRPRRFQLICQGGNTEGEGWSSHCVCPPGTAGVDESRYVLPIPRRRERYSRTSATVIRVVHCVPTDGSVSPAVASASVQRDLDSAVAALEQGLHDHDAIEAGRCGVTVERWRSMPIEDRVRCGSGGGDGVSEARVREIVREETRGFVTREQLDDTQSGDSSQRDPASIGPGMFGFRLSVLFSTGVRNLHLQDQDSIPPLFLGGEFGMTASFADRWYIEGAVAFGYAFESAPFQESLHGQYRLGFMHLFDAWGFPLGVAFGGVLSERYSGVFDSGTFRSDHTLAGAYADLLIHAPTRGFALFGFVRAIGGVGLRFYSPADHINADGSIQIGIGISRFGDDAPAPSEEEGGN